MNLFGGTKSKITKNKNGGSVLYLEIIEVVLLHCNIVNNDYKKDSRVLFTFIPKNRLVSCWIAHIQILYFCKLLIQNLHTLVY